MQKHYEGLLSACPDAMVGRSLLTSHESTLVKDPSKTKSLEDYWQEHQYQEEEEAVGPISGEDSPSAMKEKRRQAKSSPNGQPRSRNRAVSGASALASPGQMLSAHHPALSLSTFLDTFGPLVFPLYKAALQRKRILLIGHAPVELACNFGEDLPYIDSPFLMTRLQSTTYPSSQPFRPPFTISFPCRPSLPVCVPCSLPASMTSPPLPPAPAIHTPRNASKTKAKPTVG